MVRTYIYNSICALGVFFAPLHIVVVSIFGVVILDLISALISAWFNKIPITSKRMRTTIGKLFAYFILIISAHLVDNMFIIPFIGNTLMFKFVSFLIGTIEFKSIIENVNKVIKVRNLKEQIFSFFAQNKK